ncbi:MAG: HsdR family type I site-specific deoxyribonuclease [Deltaproteobacteria bacterium]|nr:HsdR family type I site-specific deoxyribonuclease [Deltaproteobacteria bacterium]
MNDFSERFTVQDPFLRYAKEAGWEYLEPDKAMGLREKQSKPFLHKVLFEQLQKLNPEVGLTEINTLVEELEKLPPNIYGNHEAWKCLTQSGQVLSEAEKRNRNVRLLDTRQPWRNRFHVTKEFTFQKGKRSIRADLVFFINGIPVLLVETKSAIQEEGIAQALAQIRRYHDDAPDLMVHVQLFVLTNLKGFFYGPTWSLSPRNLANYKEEQARDFESLVKSFVDPEHLIRMLAYGILFVKKSEAEFTKNVLRPHQIRAAARAVARAKDPTKKRGLVWHTQGSGKTYTMLAIARELMEDPALGNPTVLLVVDRNELEGQLLKNLESVDLKGSVADSKKHLYDLLKAETRGLILSMIHKFDDIPQNLCTRDNVFVLVDEAHRSTGGHLGNHLMAALPNATFIGFTGTPIDRGAGGKSTFTAFGRDDPKGYLDKYSITESIADGTTLPIYYEEAPNYLFPNKDLMDQEFWQAIGDGVAEMEEIDRVLDRAVRLKDMLKNSERVDKVAAFVAQHFKRHVHPKGYKAFLVAPDREGCVLYKEALNSYLKPEWSAVVISHGHNDPEHLRQYHMSENDERNLREAFKKPNENPQILIVTEKLLTGYDAPILYCMYLDKPMRDHVLLQAMARVNRPYEDSQGRRKGHGLIVDFVGILEDIGRALAFDMKEELADALQSIDAQREHFAKLMDEGRKKLEQVHLLEQVHFSEEAGDKAIEAILKHFRREDFAQFFCELKRLYEALSPDPFLADYIRDYKRLEGVYKVACRKEKAGSAYVKEVASIVRKHTRTDKLDAPNGTFEIGPEGLKWILLFHGQELDEAAKPYLDEIHRLVEEEESEEPRLRWIGERAEEICRRFMEGQMQSQELLKQLSELLQAAKEVQLERLLSFRIGQKSAKQAVNDIKAVFEEYPHWMDDPRQEGMLRFRLYKTLGETLGKDHVVDLTEEVLKLFRTPTTA